MQFKFPNWSGANKDPRDEAERMNRAIEKGKRDLHKIDDRARELNSVMNNTYQWTDRRRAAAHELENLEKRGKKISGKVDALKGNEYEPSLVTPEVIAAGEVLTRFWTSGDQGVEEGEHAILLAAARSEPAVLEGMIRRLYQDEVRTAVQLGNAKPEEYKIARSLAVLKAQRYGFTNEEIEKVLGKAE